MRELGKRKTNKIKSIVSRFYATNDYTEDAGAGSIPYIHKGEPQYISSLQVRVLNPDGQVATEVNNDNTVFLQIVYPSDPPAGSNR